MARALRTSGWTNKRTKVSCRARRGIGPMRRRDFIALLGGAAAPWPLKVRAQQPDPVQRIGALMGLPASDPEAQAFFSAFTQALDKMGWTAGSTMQMDVRWGSFEVDRIRMLAKELVALRPDVILSYGTAVTAVLQKETQTI